VKPHVHPNRVRLKRTGARTFLGMTTTQTLVGPIQLIVIGFPSDAQFRGDTMRALSNLRGRGVIRIIDAMFVRKDADGRINASIRESDLSLVQREKLGAVVGGLFGLARGGDGESEALGATLAVHAIADNAFGFGIGDLQNVKDQIPPSSAALLLLIEHQWATELKAAVRDAGGVPVIQGFLTPEVLLMVGEEMRIVVEAEDTIAAARAIEGAALLAAMTAVQTSELVQQAAVAETARVLIAAGLIEAAAVDDVVNTLVAADLIKQEALAEARSTIAAANGQAPSNGHTPPGPDANGTPSASDTNNEPAPVGAGSEASA
jgi:uncharacterized membrane protein